MTPEELATYAEANSFQHVFRYEMPPTPDAAIAIKPYGGRPGEHEFGTAPIVWEFPRLQVTVRGAPGDTVEPHTRAADLAALYGAVQLITLSNVVYRGLTVLQPPFWLMKDANNRHTFVFNVEPYKHA